MSLKHIICGIFCFIGFFASISQLDTTFKLGVVGICGMIAVSLSQPDERKG